MPLLTSGGSPGPTQRCWRATPSRQPSRWMATIACNMAQQRRPMRRGARRASAPAGTQRLIKATPTLRSAADQYAYGEKAHWAWDWNLALPHFVLGVDWDGIFGF